MLEDQRLKDPTVAYVLKCFELGYYPNLEYALVTLIEALCLEKQSLRQQVINCINKTPNKFIYNPLTKKITEI